jgi:hypothetical protein
MLLLVIGLGIFVAISALVIWGASIMNQNVR